MTSQKDLGPLTLRIILLAFSSPDKCPTHLQVYSDNRSLNEYKKCFELESKEELRGIYTPIEVVEQDYERNKASIPPNRLGEYPSGAKKSLISAHSC